MNSEISPLWSTLMKSQLNHSVVFVETDYHRQRGLVLSVWDSNLHVFFAPDLPGKSYNLLLFIT
jgi:hypothetical protein